MSRFFNSYGDEGPVPVLNHRELAPGVPVERIIGGRAILATDVSPHLRNPSGLIAPGFEKAKPLSKAELQASITVLGHEMEHISDNPGGSDPQQYLAPDNYQTLLEVKKHWDEEGWPGAIPISMEVPRNPMVSAWKHGAHDFAKKTPLRRSVFNKPKGQEVKGYVIARLSCAQYAQPVAVCTDGNGSLGFYSLRGPELHHSNAFDWGKLPDPKLLAAATDKNVFEGIVYDKHTIKPYLSFKNMLYLKSGLKNPDHM